MDLTWLYHYKTVHGVETYFPVKKTFWAQQSVKKVMLTIFWDMKGTIAIDFLEKVQL